MTATIDGDCECSGIAQTLSNFVRLASNLLVAAATAAIFCIHYSMAQLKLIHLSPLLCKCERNALTLMNCKCSLQVNNDGQIWSDVVIM